MVWRNRELRSPWWLAILTLCAIVLFTQLGRWQLRRADEKRALQAAFDTGSLKVEDLGQRTLRDLPRYQTVRLSGHYEGAHQFLLDNMTEAGRIGYQVLTPFRLEGGRLVMVNRGWIELPQGSRRTLPAIAIETLSDGPLVGRVDELPVPGIAAGRAAPETGPEWPKRTSFPTSEQLSAALAEPVEPRELLLGADEPKGYLRHWHSASEQFPPLRHIGYAVQWFAFAALALVLFVSLNLKPRTPP